MVGASLEEPEEEEDAKSTDSNFNEPSKKEGCYEVVGTMKNKDGVVPAFVKEVIKVCIHGNTIFSY